MAAADYYDGAPMRSRNDYNYPDERYQNYPPSPARPANTRPSPYASPNTLNAYSQGAGYHNSQQSLRPAETNYSNSSLGRTEDPNQYSESIPLKQNMMMSGAKDEWRDQHTKYNGGSLESQQPLTPNGVPEDEKRKKGFFKGKISWVVYFLTLVQCSVFIGEIVKYAILTGSPIEIHPSFNIMIGPSPELYINMGARYVPCMRVLSQIQGSDETIDWPCPNTTSSNANAASNQCTLSELCGMGGINYNSPNQWWRFITPMFLHAGVIHIGINMLMQMTMGRQMELQIGSIRFALVYFSSGIFGFVLGGNFAKTGIASTGASGALFGIMGLYILDLFYTWRDRPSPIRDLMFALLDVVIAFVLGLLPGVVDNFSHMGGLLMGLCLGVCLLRSPNALQQRIGSSRAVYEPMDHSNRNSQYQNPDYAGDNFKAFTKKPVGFFKGRKPFWWAWWLIRAAALVGVTIAFIVLLNNFYKYHNTCSWCQYLSCLPIKDWCEIGNLDVSTSNSSSSTSKRDLFKFGFDGLAHGMFE